MKFITFKIRSQTRLGMLSEDENQVYDISSMTLGQGFSDMNDLIKGITDEDLYHLSTICKGQSIEMPKSYLMEDVTLCPPIIHPRHDVLCLGLNYNDHVKETAKGFSQNIELPKHPVYFSKRVHRAIGPGEDIDNRLEITKMLDYEVELAVVIGKEGVNIPKEKAEDYIFGYTIMNDISAREIQQRHQQWFKGKSLDTFTSLGPCIVHKSKMTFPLTLNLWSRVNGEIRQNGNTKDLIFDIADIIHDLSQGMTLRPGDIIATGTPSGVGMGFNPPRYLKSGDIVECEIEGIGILKNTVK